MLGLIKRTFVVKTPEVMSNLYKTLVVLAYRRSSCARSLSSILLRAYASFTGDTVTPNIHNKVRFYLYRCKSVEV